jgi:hypothetical protein
MVEKLKKKHLRRERKNIFFICQPLDQQLERKHERTRDDPNP